MLNTLICASEYGWLYILVIAVVVLTSALSAICIFAAKQQKKRAIISGGKQGEDKVRAVLDSMPDEQYVINNYAVWDGNTSFQVDHILISPRGIFVIETKNWTGSVYGTQYSAQWQQCKQYGNGYKNIMHANPIKQNLGHIRHLRRILGDRYYLNSVIVMVQNNVENISADGVVALDMLGSYLMSFATRRYSPWELRFIYETLIRYQSRYAASEKEHLKNINKKR